jgi:BMFP domain-containing protein YqiC
MNSNFFSDIQGKINQALESGPAKDIERNVKAAMTQGFAKLDLVTREEFDIQAQVLAKTRSKLEALELRVLELESRLSSQPSAANAANIRAEAAATAASGARSDSAFPAAPEDPTVVVPPASGTTLDKK